MLPRRVGIVGVGLLGGSIGLAVKSLVHGCQVVGYGHRASTLDYALRVGAIDRGSTCMADVVRGCTLVILCTPVGLFHSMLEQLAPLVDPGTVVTDVGSTKRTVVRLGERILPEYAHFVGSHPMAGSEKRGVEFARPDLFQNCLCIMTPTRRTCPDALSLVEAFWKSLGMEVKRLPPQVHDRLLADVSHLPHALAAALVAMQRPEGLPLAGKGFLDATRIAAGDGALWRDILRDNRDNVRMSLRRLRRQLTHLEKLLANPRGEALARWLDRSSRRRQELLQKKLREVNPD